MSFVLNGGVPYSTSLGRSSLLFETVKFTVVEWWADATAESVRLVIQLYLYRVHLDRRERDLCVF